MEVKERQKLLVALGGDMEKYLDDFYGNVVLNFQNGKFINMNVTETYKAEKHEDIK